MILDANASQSSMQKRARALEPIKDCLVEWFKHRFLSDRSWQQHFAAAQTPHYTSEEDAGLILQSLVAVGARSSQFLDRVTPAFDLAARRGVNSPVVDPAAAATPIHQWSRNPPHQSLGIHRKKQQWQKVTVGTPQGIEWDQVKHSMAHRGGTAWVEQHHMKEEETTLFQSTTFRTQSKMLKQSTVHLEEKQEALHGGKVDSLEENEGTIAEQ